MSLRALAAIPIAVVALATGIGTASRANASAPAIFDPQGLIAQLQATAADWNRGDLEAFIAPYDADSTFMTAGGPIGRDAMRDHYRSKYFGPGGEKPRPLRFEQIVVRPLGDDHALMTGRFVLGGDGRPDLSGWFTLVWVRSAGAWRILHDHSS